MAITISGENNNDRILASDGVIDQISGINIVGLITASHINVGSNIQLGNAGIVTATTFVGNVTGNVNSASPLLLQTGGSERFRITGNNELGIAGANYGSSGQVLTSGGSGSAVSWTTPAVTGFTNGSNNRVVTATSGSGLNGEAYLTFDGSNLAISGSQNSSLNNNILSFDRAGYSYIDQTSNSGSLVFRVSSSSTQALRLDSSAQSIFGASGAHIINYSGSATPHNNNCGALLSSNNIGLIGRYSTLNQPFDHSTATTSGNWWMLGRSTGTTNEWGLNVRTGSSNSNINVWKVIGNSNGHITYQAFYSSNGQERLRIASDGDVFIGNSNLGTNIGSTAKLEVIGTLNNSYPQYSYPIMVSDDAAYNSSAGPGGGIGFAFKQNSGGSYAQAGGIRGIKENTTDGNYASALTFYTRANGAGTEEQVRIDSSGRLLLGTTTEGHSNADDLTIATSGNTGITIRSGASNGGNIFFSDATSGDGEYAGMISYDHNDNIMTFHTIDGTERVRLTNAAAILNSDNTNATAALSSLVFQNGIGEVSRIRGETRNGNTNGMITFFSTISGSSAERMRINHDGAFCFGNNSARPAEFTQPNGFSLRWDDKGQFQSSVTDTTCGLLNRKGSNGQILGFRKDGTGVGEIGVNATTMYLNFGGTNAAQHQLDDYEEGDLTLTLVGTSGGSANYGYRTGHYTKIGNICHVTGDIRFNGSWSGSTGSVHLNLPFTAEATGGCVGAGIVSEWNLSSSNWDNIMIKVDNNESVARFTAHSGNNNNTSNFQTDLFGNGRYLKFAFTYQTA